MSEKPPVQVLTAVQPGPLAVEELNWPIGCGAECCFVGRTRGETHPQHGELLYLAYEVYEPMARKLLDQMARDAAKKWDCRVVRIVHAQGKVDLGAASVVIQVGTPHRGDSFTACRYLIDRLKHELPIWKHEHWQRGTTIVEGSVAYHEPE